VFLSPCGLWASEINNLYIRREIMSVQFGTVFAYIIGIILLFLLARVFLVPIKIILRLLYNALLGGIILLLINFVGGIFAFHIPLNFITALLTGFLGIPGIILLVILNFLFKI